MVLLFFALLPCLPSPTWSSSLRLHDRLALAILGVLLVSSWPTGLFQPITDPVEQEALFHVLTGINSDVDWKSRLPDACLGNQQGIYCMVDDNSSDIYHVTNLEFGFVSEYDTFIRCSSKATIHPSISRLRFLQTLFIYNCFQNTSGATIPKEIGLLSGSLQMLTLHGNPGLVGPLPAEMGNLSSLERLVLTENSINGSIPRELGKLHQLLQLDLSENLLEGTIPGSLNSLQSLLILNLGYNHLSGPLPSLGRLSQLEQLVISHNKLSRGIPLDLGNLSALLYLDLSYNRLSGGIPASFANLTKLETLFLESNSMHSVRLPAFVGSMVGLASLTISKSGFIGEIPRSLGKLINLRVLELSGNNFSGHLPGTLGGLPSIYRLDVSSNNLTGPVPFSPSFIAKMGENLVVMDNSDLCLPPATLQESVEDPGLNLRLCNGSSTEPAFDADPPTAALGPSLDVGRLHYTSYALSRLRLSMKTIVFMVLLGIITGQASIIAE